MERIFKVENLKKLLQDNAAKLINNRSKYICVSYNGESLWISKNVAIYAMSNPLAASLEIQDQEWKGVGKVKVVCAKVYMTF